MIKEEQNAAANIRDTFEIRSSLLIPIFTSDMSFLKIAASCTLYIMIHGIICPKSQHTIT